MVKVYNPPISCLIPIASQQTSIYIVIIHYHVQRPHGTTNQSVPVVRAPCRRKP
ncbi:hypothetical protein BDW59DRAFT_153234 [Aspergillus cavernicola]|uniref:Uncharacterized protein n=1 Tax=Aspergillus cavernicola TaxID=176166 RepID=A0ABR4HMN3_9EURO